MKTQHWLALGAGALLSLSASAQTPEVTLTRIDCGTAAKPTNVNERFSDTFAYKDLNLVFTFSCYLVKHGDEYMVWDTGFAPGSNPNAPKVGIVERLKELKVTPDQVKYVGISHFHGDHTGQLINFPKATLADRRGRLERRQLDPADAGRQRARLHALAQGRLQGRAAGDRQGRVRRRHGRGAAHAGPHAGPQLPAGASSRKRAR